MIHRGVHPQSPSRKQWSKPIVLPAKTRRQSFVQQRIAAIHAEIATLGQSDADIAAKLQPSQAWQEVDADADAEDAVCHVNTAQSQASNGSPSACEVDRKARQESEQRAAEHAAQCGQEQQARHSQYRAVREASESRKAVAAKLAAVRERRRNKAIKAQQDVARRAVEHAECCKQEQQKQESQYRAVRQAAERKEAASPAVARTAARRATMNAATEFERQATIEKQERDELAAELAKCAKLRRDVDNEQRQDETLRVNKLQMELQMLQQLQDDDDTTASRPEEVGEACGQGSPAESLRHRRRQPDIFVGGDSSRSSPREGTPTRPSTQPSSSALKRNSAADRALESPQSASRQNALAARRKRLERAAANSAQRGKAHTGTCTSTPTRRRKQLPKSAASSGGQGSPAPAPVLSTSRQNALSARRRRLERAGRTPFNVNSGTAKKAPPLSARAEFNASPCQTPPSQRRLATRAQRHYAASPVCRSSAETGAQQFRSSSDWLLSLREGFTVTSDAREVDETLYL